MSQEPSGAGPRFPLGRMLATPGALEKLTHGDIIRALRRHLSGDWGDVCAEDKAANDRDLRTGGRLVSVYHSTLGVKFYIITEWDRSATTVLLPHEY